MIRTGCALLGLLLTSSFAGAQSEAPRFKFRKGQVLTYKVEQVTQATETAAPEENKPAATHQTTTKLNLVKRWTVADVDAQGVATLELSLASMRLERKLPNAEPDVFDSAAPDKDNQQEMARLIGKTLAVLRLDGQGQIVEVKESNYGPPSRFVADLPFKITLPAAAPKDGESWGRSYAIKLDPPQGTGETYQASQKFTAKEEKQGFTVIGVETSVKDMPAAAADQIPLLPLMPEGDVYFHGGTGLYYAARLRVKKELADHQGEGSKYVFVSTYAEDYVQAKKD